MKILVTGKNGQLGHDVIHELASRHIAYVGADVEEFDITDENATWAFINECKPTHVIHCAAYTAVDKAEAEADLCQKINVNGTEHIARACRQLGCKMMYISTDYVFPGTGNEPYEVNDTKGPETVYGQTKLDGELAAQRLVQELFIVRVSWVFGVNGHNFVKTMLRLGNEREEVSVVTDQIGSPTYTCDLAKLLCDMIVTDKYGVYHATNEGTCSWAEFTEEIFRLAGYDCNVKHIPSDAYSAAAKRPMNSRMSKASLDAAGFRRLPAWQDALERYIDTLSSLDIHQ